MLFMVTLCLQELVSVYLVATSLYTAGVSLLVMESAIVVLCM